MTTKPKRSIGDELKSRREQLGLSLHNVEVATKIRGHYLRAIESGDYAGLPNDIYSRGFVRQYAHYLGLPAQALAERYDAERGELPATPRKVKPRPIALRLGATSRLAVTLAALSAIALVIMYLVWQFSSLTAAPSLTLQSPNGDEVVQAASIRVAGRAAPGSELYLNGSSLPSDVGGSFETTLILQPGVNEVQLVAKNKLGKQTVLTRHVLSKQNTSSTLPNTSYDGVAVLLKALDSVKVTLSIDGVEQFNGNLAKGASRLVQGKTVISITTDDPSSLRATLTNQLVAGYDFGILGSSGTQRTIEFTKTTQPTP